MKKDVRAHGEDFELELTFNAPLSVTHKERGLSAKIVATDQGAFEFEGDGSGQEFQTVEAAAWGVMGGMARQVRAEQQAREDREAGQQLLQYFFDDLEHGGEWAPEKNPTYEGGGSG